MFCSSCGAQSPDDAAFCSKCGASGQPAKRELAAQVSSEIRASSRDALFSARSLLLDPVGGLEPVYRALGVTRARSAGIALAVTFALLCAVGLSIGAQRLRGFGGNPFSSFLSASEAQFGVGTFLKLFIAFLAPPAAIILAAFGLRRLLKAAPPLGADAFVAGVALLPLGLGQLAAALLGVGNFEVALLLMFLAWCYLILILFTGLTKVGGLSERAGAPIVPILLLLAGWITKVLWVALV